MAIEDEDLDPVLLDEKNTFKFPVMERLRAIAKAANGWSVIVGVPGDKYLHVRPVKYKDETETEARQRRFLEAELKRNPEKHFVAPARTKGVRLDGEPQAATETVSAIPM